MQMLMQLDEAKPESPARDLSIGARVTFRDDAAHTGTILMVTERQMVPYVVRWDAWPDMQGWYDAADLQRVEGVQ